KEQGRPIIIFPQGTRVWTHETSKDKRYKPGVWSIQDATKLDIIPMATNSGAFWPRSGWLKSSGVVTFKFLKPIKVGKSKDKLMSALEKDIEAESNALIEEAEEESNVKKKGLPILPFLIALIILAAAGTYSYMWHNTAEIIRGEYATFMTNLGRSGAVTEPKISGFPGPIKLSVIQETLKQSLFNLEAQIIEAEIWPVPYTPIKLTTGPLILSTVDWSEPIAFDSLEATFTAKHRELKIEQAIIKKDELRLGMSGDIDLSQKPFPKLDTILMLRGFEDFIATLAEKDVIEDRIAMFLTFGFSNLKNEDGWVRVPLLQRGQKLYAGPLPIVDLPELFDAPSVLEQEVSPGSLPRLEPYNQLGPAQ
ncbi:MAG: DUF2125 domain-containing protein, partial [Pseudomonadota bacterium]